MGSPPGPFDGGMGQGQGEEMVRARVSGEPLDAELGVEYLPESDGQVARAIVGEEPGWTG